MLRRDVSEGAALRRKKLKKRRYVLFARAYRAAQLTTPNVNTGFSSFFTHLKKDVRSAELQIFRLLMINADGNCVCGVKKRDSPETMADYARIRERTVL